MLIPVPLLHFLVLISAFLFVIQTFWPVHREKAEGMSGVLEKTKDVKTAIPNCFTPYPTTLPKCFTPYKVSSQREGWRSVSSLKENEGSETRVKECVELLIKRRTWRELYQTVSHPAKPGLSFVYEEWNWGSLGHKVSYTSEKEWKSVVLFCFVLF